MDLSRLQSLANENDRLKGEVERLSEELRLANCEITDLKVDVDVTIRENATLRSKLDAMVTAARQVNESKVTELVDNGECAADGEPLMDETGDYIVDANDWDALSAAVTEAKGEK